MLRTAMVFLCLVVLGSAGCTRQQARYQHRTSDALVIAMRKEPISLNPLLLEGTDSYAYSELLFSYLTNYRSDGRVVGDIAREVPSIANGGISDGGTRITYRLRRGVRWQDGAPLTAADVVFTYHAIMNPANDVPERYGYDVVASIAAPDPYTVVITLKRPFSPIIGYFFGGDSNNAILPAHLLRERHDLNTAAFNAQPVGSGPYRFDRWDRGDHVTLTANGSYYAGRPRIGRLVLPFISSDSTTISELQTGEVDAAFMLDASRIAELRAIPDHRVIVTPVPYFYAISFNLQDPLTSDLAVRQAIALAIDRRALTRKISRGVYRADTAMRGLFTWAYDPAADKAVYDPAQARAVLARDGWTQGRGGIATKHGRALRLQLSYAAGSDITSRFAVAIAAAVRAVGIDMTLRSYERGQFVETDGPLIQGRYQVSLYDYQGGYDPDASWLLSCGERSPHGLNVSRYCNADVDRLLERGAASYDRAARAAVYRQVQRRIARSLPYYFLCQISEVDVIPAQLGGYAPPLLSPFNSAASWYWESPKAPAD
ncbi:MAG TPA: peptide ABC transporter substrate-binding protein [Candidatus Lustribacter sp.]